MKVLTVVTCSVYDAYTQRVLIHTYVYSIRILISDIPCYHYKLKHSVQCTYIAIRQSVEVSRPVQFHVFTYFLNACSSPKQDLIFAIAPIQSDCQTHVNTKCMHKHAFYNLIGAAGGS